MHLCHYKLFSLLNSNMAVFLHPTYTKLHASIPYMFVCIGISTKFLLYLYDAASGNSLILVNFPLGSILYLSH